MRTKIQAIEYDENVEVTATNSLDHAREAVEWCETRRGAKLNPGDTELGYAPTTVEEALAMGEPPLTHPPKWYEVHGEAEDGSVEYLEQGDHDEIWNKWAGYEKA